MPRRLLLALGALAVVAVMAIGLAQAGSDSDDADEPTLSAAQQRTMLAGAPPALAALHAQGGALLPGSRTAVRKRLADLQAAGHPVVINNWAAWCGPCRLEFPIFQRVSAKLGKQVAFLGVDTNDDADAARAFLDTIPLSYPSYEDRTSRIAQDLEVGRAFPSTVFIDARGRHTVHQGPYVDDDALEQAIRRYALTAGA